MYKKTVTYEDYNGLERTEDFYFHLSENEVIEFQLTSEGGVVEMLNRIINAKDSEEIIAMFKKIVLMAYGVKSDDGRRFVKNDEVRADFMASPAYSQIFMELAFDSDEASRFINGIIPKKVGERVQEYINRLKNQQKGNTNLSLVGDGK